MIDDNAGRWDCEDYSERAEENSKCQNGGAGFHSRDRPILIILLLAVTQKSNAGYPDKKAGAVSKTAPAQRANGF
jgi:hypothetical protein